MIFQLFELSLLPLCFIFLALKVDSEKYRYIFVVVSKIEEAQIKKSSKELIPKKDK